MRNNKITKKKGVEGLFCTLYIFEEKDFTKRIEAFEITGIGCFVQTTVENSQHEMVVDTIMVPGARISNTLNNDGTVAESSLVKDCR